MDQANESGAPKGHVAVRLDEGMIARIDALLPLYALPGRQATRSDALRALILAGFEGEEQRAAQQFQLEKAPLAPKPRQVRRRKG